MRVPLQNAPEEAGACGEDDLVRHHLVLLTRKRHVQQLLLLFVETPVRRRHAILSASWSVSKLCLLIYLSLCH